MISIGYQDLTSELDTTEIRRLLLFQSWLRRARFEDSPQAWEAAIRDMRIRTAPSIITRSEAELFGISIPRFAYRATLTDPDGVTSLGFVNLRRVNSFRMAIGERLELSRDDEFLTQFHRRCPCIADALLLPPAHLSNEFDIITTDLSHAYAESCATAGVPFVTHFPVGGGMCAQAVCFQANALCHQFAAGVFGVAEITTLSSVDDTFLDFSGLTSNNIC